MVLTFFDLASMVNIFLSNIICNGWHAFNHSSLCGVMFSEDLNVVTVSTYKGSNSVKYLYELDKQLSAFAQQAGHHSCTIRSSLSFIYVC